MVATTAGTPPASVHGVLADGVEDPVHLGGPAAVVGVVHLLHEVVHSLLLRLVQGQCLADVGDVVEGLQLGHAGAQHHGEQVDEEVGVLADGQIGLVAHLLEPEGGTEWRGGRTPRERYEWERVGRKSGATERERTSTFRALGHLADTFNQSYLQ